MNTRPSNSVAIHRFGGCLLCLLCLSVSSVHAGKPQHTAKGKPQPTAKGKPAQQKRTGKKQPSKSRPDKQQKSQNLFDGKTMGKWAVVKKYDFQAHGPIEVRDGAIAIGAGSPASGIRWTGKMPRIDYEISLEAKRTAGSDFFCGMTFPIKQSYCTLIIGGWGGSIVGLSNIDGTAASENEACTVGEFKNNRWCKIRLRVTSAKIEVWIDKEKVIDQQTAGHKFAIWWEQEPMRPLGIATWATGSALKNISLEKLDANGSPKAQAKKAQAGNGKK
ncbi:MAG: DUF1080 domain-containing protein [Planctomycetota bacterium]|nr:DUF1080 domain-containing protein [Planctomycetota bacterium]